MFKAQFGRRFAALNMVDYSIHPSSSSHAIEKPEKGTFWKPQRGATFNIIGRAGTIK